MSQEKKQIYGLIGYPVKHSLSPLMHNAAFRAQKINAEYRLFELRELDLENFLKTLASENIFGLNVTIPYKEKVIPFLDNISAEAKLIGAVNTIKASNNKLTGFNTDAEGFLRHLRLELGFNPEAKNIAIIGSGGASRAVSVSLGRNNPAKISIFDLDTPKTQALVEHLRQNFPKVEFTMAESIEQLGIGKCHLLINATPVGMKSAHPCIVDAKFFHRGLLVYDLIYNPKETKLLKAAKENGAQTSNGLGMLLYQGIAAFELWTEKKAPVEAMRKALKEGVNKI